MRAIIADNDSGGQFGALLDVLSSDEWRELWQGLGLALATFESLGLARDAPDALVWDACQANGVLLVTGNRNDDGPESLEATLRARNQGRSLPVFTLVHPDRIRPGAGETVRVAVKLLEHLLEIDRSATRALVVPRLGGVPPSVEVSGG
jgi:hypothetical protein